MLSINMKSWYAILTLFFPELFGANLISSQDVPEFCNVSDKNQTVKVLFQTKVSLSMCIKDESKNLISVLINNETMAINDALAISGLGVYVRENGKDRFNVTINIWNISEQTPLKYEGKLTFPQGELIYTFDLALQDFLYWCESERNQTAITTQMYENVTIHVCYESEFQISHFLINNVSYNVNENAVGDDIAVTNQQINTQHSRRKYYLQIYFRNISSTKAKDYSLEIRSKGNKVLRHEIQLIVSQIKDITQVFDCEGQKSKMYYYTQLKRNFTICRKVLNRIIKNVTYVIFGLKTPEPLNNVYLYNKSSAISMDVVDVTEYNFGRYDIIIEFDGNETKTFTFYLIKEEDVPSSECEGGTTNTTILSNSDGSVAFCFATFGLMDQSVYLNAQSFPISLVASAVKVTNDIFDNVTVSTRWSKSLKQKYIQAKLFVTNSMNLTVGFESVDRNLTYNIISTKPVCVFHQNRSFTAKLGEEINITLCERLTFTRAISIFVNDRQIVNESHQHKSYSILDSNVETESKKLILKLTNITDDNIGNSTIRIALDNVCTFTTTIIISKQSSAKRPIDSTDSMSYVSYTAPLVTVALCSTVCVLIVYLKKFCRGGLCRTLRHKLQAGSKKSQNGTYVNCEDVSENGYMNHLDLQPSRISMIGIPNITDDTHIYSNTRGIKEEISSTSSYENLKGRYFNREGLQYITIIHGHTASSPAPHQLSQSSESVAYASIDSEKTKLIALK